MGKTVQRNIAVVLLLLACAAGAGWYGLSRRAVAAAAGPPGKTGQAAAVPVAAVTVGRRDVPIYLDGLGTVQAFQTVTVRSQIDGQLSKVVFKEGQDVHKGDLLAEIDPRTYQAQLDQVLAKKIQDEAREQQDRAKVTQDQAKKVQDQAFERQAQAKKVVDQATLSNARLNLKRYQDTLASGGSTEQNITDTQMLIAQTEALLQEDDAAIQGAAAAIQVDDAATQGDQAALLADKAAIQADDGAIAYAKTFLSYASITSPVDGRTGIRMMDAGNIVHAASATQLSQGTTGANVALDPNAIVVITQLEPISVVFTLPQRDLTAVNERMAQEQLPVLAFDGDGKLELDRGTLQLVDNLIDQTTGTMRLKAVFPNARRKLWPGGFVNVRLLLEIRRDATALAATAVQQGPNGAYVYLIKPDETVEARPVDVALIQDGEAILKSGVKPGDQVVLSGHDRLKVGSKVAVAKRKTEDQAKAKGAKEADPKDSHEKAQKAQE